MALLRLILASAVILTSQAHGETNVNSSPLRFDVKPVRHEKSGYDTTIELHNPTDMPVEIVEIVSSCPCQAAPTCQPQIIFPHSREVITLKWRSIESPKGTVILKLSNKRILAVHLQTESENKMKLPQPQFILASIIPLDGSDMDIKRAIGSPAINDSKRGDASVTVIGNSQALKLSAEVVEENTQLVLKVKPNRSHANTSNVTIVSLSKPGDEIVKADINVVSPQVLQPELLYFTNNKK